MKKLYFKICLYVSLLLPIVSCDDFIDPAPENILGKDDIYYRPNLAQGLLINAYLRIPTNGWSFSEMATDDAVSNDLTNGYLNMATGQWASNSNPVDRWTSAQSAIQYINVVLEEIDEVNFSEIPSVNQMFSDRIKGEAYGLRALFMYYLLQAHGGVAGGELLGIPINLQSQNVSSDFNQPRSTFEQCMDQLYTDVDQALALLPMDYQNINDEALVPAQYRELGAKASDYNRAFGDDAIQLLSGRIALAVKAQAALLAASPAFNLSSDQSKWAEAAEYSGDILTDIGGLSGMDPQGHTWYANTSEIDNIGGGANPREILWRTTIGDANNSLETQNFPPTLFGEGLVNPTQNLVEAFPMASGYPIGDPASGYLAEAPYQGRDPRLQAFIVVNGSTAGASNKVIDTAQDSETNDGLNKVESSTRTGYYLRKLLRQDVNLDPVSNSQQRHIQPRIRYTEIFLIYAEAANEAWGPTAMGNYSFSAYDVIKAIRQRAGIGLSNGDPYLESIKGDQEAMRNLIRNERRLELSFEGFRFWDLRRWDLSLTETAKGIRIMNDSDYAVINVENRVYADYMIYGPVPYSEILKFAALQQNSGW